MEADRADAAAGPDAAASPAACPFAGPLRRDRRGRARPAGGRLLRRRAGGRPDRERRHRAAGRGPPGLLGDPDRARQRLRPPPPLLGAEPRHALPPRTAGRTSRRSSSGSGGGSTAPSTRTRSAPRRCAAVSTRCARGPRRSSTTTPRRTPSTARSTSSPTRSPSSACAACSATRSATGTGRSGPPPASPRTCASSPGRAGLARGMMGAHASFTLSDDTLAALVDAARLAGAGVHIHVAEDAADQRRRRGAVRPRRGRPTQQGRRRHRAGPARPLRARRRRRGAGRHGRGRDRRLQPPQQHEQLGRVLAVQPPRRPVALGTDGIGGDMFTESQVGFFRAREADVATAGDWPLARLAEGARFAGRSLRRAAARHAPTRRPRRPRRPRLPDADPAVTPTTSRATGSSGSRRARSATCTSPASSSSPIRRSTRVDEAKVAAAGRRARPKRLWARTGRRSPHTTSHPRGERALMRVALYLQDLHPIRDGMDYARYAEERGFEAVWQAESRLVREATVPMAAYAAVDEPHQGRLRRDSDLDPQRRPARRHVLHARRAGAGAGHPRPGRLVGAARREGRRRPAQAAAGDARGRRSHPAAAGHGTGHLPRRVRPPRRRRDRHRARRPFTEAGADLHRRHGHADDGAGRRDRRRRRAQLHGRPRLQQARPSTRSPPAPTRPAVRSTTSTVRSSSSARSTATAPWRSTGRASC